MWVFSCTSRALLMFLYSSMNSPLVFLEHISSLSNVQYSQDCVHSRCCPNWGRGRATPRKWNKHCFTLRRSLWVPPSNWIMLHWHSYATKGSWLGLHPQNVPPFFGLKYRIGQMVREEDSVPEIKWKSVHQDFSIFKLMWTVNIIF